MPRSHLWGVIPWQQIVDLTLFVPVDDGPEGCGQIGVRLGGVEVAGFDQRGDGARSRAISSRSLKLRLRLVIDFADGESCVGGMPPELRNHRTPTGPETPASMAAFSLEMPDATARQNRHMLSRCQIGGRPGERNLPRIDCSDLRLPVVIATS